MRVCHSLKARFGPFSEWWGVSRKLLARVGVLILTWLQSLLFNLTFLPFDQYSLIYFLLNWGVEVS
jgi:hypothetical protein